MAFKNFKPVVWSAGIEREIERESVYILDCYRKYEGDVSKAGDEVTIVGIGKPTVTTTTNKDITLGSPETVEDTSIKLRIDHVSYYNYKVDDIDKREAIGGITEALRGETSEVMAYEVDSKIAALAALAEAKKVNAAGSETTVDKDKILPEMSKCIKALRKQNVKTKDIIFTLSVDAAALYEDAIITLDTNNSEYLKNGYIGKYKGATVRVSNNTYVTGGVDYMMVRTKRAIAYVQPMTHSEAYRPEAGFADAIKGFTLYGHKIVRPKELIIMNVKY